VINFSAQDRQVPHYLMFYITFSSFSLDRHVHTPRPRHST